MPSLKEKFDTDKNFLTAKTEEFLKDSNIGEPLKANRDEVNEAVKNGNFTEALQKLEVLREARNGITLTKIKGEKGETPVLIRDGRNNPNEAAILGTEGFEMQYLNAVRAAIDIAEIEQKPKQFVDELKANAVEFTEKFHKENENKSQAEISKNMQSEIDNLAGILSKNGIEKAHKKLNVAKDFQNFNDEHCNIVTLSKAQNSQQTLIEAEVAFKGLTKEQKEEYQNREGKNWYNVMPEWERNLVDRYADTIQDGTHVIPTQLRQIVGMKNAFEKITAGFDGKDFQVLGTAKHAGTIASLSNDKNSRQKITDLNARQAQEWLGDGVTLHTNTLNSGPIGAGNDPAIVAQTKQAMKSIGGKNTNTPFNLFRVLGITNNLSGVSDTLNKIADSLPPEVSELKAHIKPRSKFERFFGMNKPKGNAEDIIKNANLTDEEKEILTQAVALRKNVEQADVPFKLFFDKENINLNISNDVNSLTEKIRQNTQDKKTTNLENLPQEETVTMCASGKDRTGLSMFDKAAQAFSKHTGIEVPYLDQLLNKNGHTAQMAGSVFAGGGTIGCHGTKSENKAGIPKSRKEFLGAIIAVTAKTNKIVDKKKQDKKLDEEYKKTRPQKPAKKEEKLETKSNIVIDQVQGKLSTKAQSSFIDNVKKSSTTKLNSSIKPSNSTVKNVPQRRNQNQGPTI